MSDAIKPALTAEEWRTQTVRSDPKRPQLTREAWCPPGSGVTVRVLSGPSICVHPDDMHALAALALYGQPFGPTRDMLEWLEHATGLADHMHGLEPETSEDAVMRDRVYAFIAALLPPTPPNDAA